MDTTENQTIPAEKTLAARIAEATSLREGPDGVVQVLRAVLKSGPLPLRDLARIVRLPLPVAGAVRRELETAGMLERGGGLRLTEAGRTFCETELGLSAPVATPIPARVAKSDLPELLRDLMPAMEAHVAAGPAVDVTLDQAPCTPETALRRAHAMVDAGGVEGRRIAIMGDDDSMSVALWLVGSALGARPRAITVFELDEARCDQLSQAARDLASPVEIVAQDLRDPLPPALVGRFDVFETDPPYTLDGMELFVRRGLEAVRRETGLPGFLSYADLAPGDQLALMRRLTELGLAATRIRPSFNRYAGASILGSVGQFIDLRTTNEPLATSAEERFSRPIYTGEVRPRLRRYRCLSCKQPVIVGISQKFETVEALKASGCPHCGEKTFRREGIVKD